MIRALVYPRRRSGCYACPRAHARPHTCYRARRDHDQSGPDRAGAGEGPRADHDRQFLRYVDGHRLDGVTFYRTVRVAPVYGFIQFGVQNALKRVLPPIKHEPTTLTGVHHTDGAISVARFAPGTAQGDFTISVGDQSRSLDADPTKPGDNAGYAAFGHVVEGMDVVKRIQDAPVATGGHFAGEQIAVPVVITSVRRVP